MSGEFSYAYRPSVLGSPLELTLKDEALEFRVGSQHGEIRYDSIRRVQMCFRPVTMQSYRFLTDIWSEGGPRIRISSTSWRSMVEQTRQDASYAAFIVELHRRIAARGSTARFSTGSPVIIYWLGLGAFMMVALGLTGLALRALWLQEWSGAALIGGFLGLFVWQLGRFFQYNRPSMYRPENVPVNVLPRS